MPDHPLPLSRGRRRPRPGLRRPAPARALLAALVLAPAAIPAQGTTAPAAPPATEAPVPARASWADRISIRGYAQVRYNRLLESNPRLVCTQCDRSLGPRGGIFMRRARVSIVARPNDRVSFVLQPDFTAEADEASGIAQVRDAYAELTLGARHTLRLRFGQTNVPFGFENLVSSQRRIPLDRVDALNSAAPTERDVGAYAHWTPPAARRRFEALLDDRGTGDAGVVSVGVWDGQTANRPEQNGNLHVGARLAWPFALPRAQVLEAAVQGYGGRYVVTAAQRTAGTAGTGGAAEFADRRVALSLVLHPRPLGLQAEWNVGTGPEADPAARAIRERRLSGGYVQAAWRTALDLRTGAGRTPVTPYVRAQRYDGGKKFETDARRHRVRELEAGVEAVLFPDVELTAAWQAAERHTADLAAPESRQRGRRLRLQLQVAF